MTDFFLPNGFLKLDSLVIRKDSAVFLKQSDEFRCEVIYQKVCEYTDNIYYIVEINKYQFKILDRNGKEYMLRNRSADESDELVESITSDDVYLDLTSIDIFEIPRLIKILHGKKNLKAIYIEPEYYESTESEAIEGDYALYETSAEIAAIPGYSLVRPDDNYSFIPFLGFQGSRLTYLREQLQALEQNTYPIIGLPGYNLEYPFTSISENRRIFESMRMLQNLNFSPAYCPFRTYRVIKHIRSRTDKIIVVGMLGTKPQALGAIIYAIKNPKSCELIYDYPKKSSGKFYGVGNYYVYFISDMWELIDNVA